MAPGTAARLARTLLQANVDKVNFYIELDTVENAALVAEELRSLGCGVLYDSNEYRLNIYVPLDRATVENDKAHKSSTHSLLSRRIHRT